MTLIQNNFDGGTDGAGTTGGITTGNSANSGDAINGSGLTIPSGSTFNYDATGAREGLGGRLQLVSAATGWRVYWQFTAASSLACRWVFCFNGSVPSSQIVLGSLIGSSTFGISCTWRVNTAGKIIVDDTLGAVLATASSACTAGTVYVFEMQVAPGTTTSNGTCNAQLYAVSSPGTLLINLANSACNMLGATNANISRGELGENDIVANLDITYDDLAFNTGTLTAIGTPALSASAAVAASTAVPPSDTEPGLAIGMTIQGH